MSKSTSRSSRSTDGSLASLPVRPDRAWLVSFGLAGSLAIGVSIAAAAWVVGKPGGVVWAAAVTATLAISSSLQPRALRRPYRLWNEMACRYLRFAQRCTLVIGFHSVFAVAARAGSALKLARPKPGFSTWTPRGTLVPRAYARIDNMDGAPASGLGALVSWARASGQGWSLCLVPFLAVLRALEPEVADSDLADADAPAGIYTLY